MYNLERLSSFFGVTEKAFHFDTIFFNRNLARISFGEQ